MSKIIQKQTYIAQAGVVTMVNQNNVILKAEGNSYLRNFLPDSI